MLKEIKENLKIQLKDQDFPLRITLRNEEWVHAELILSNKSFNGVLDVYLQGDGSNFNLTGRILGARSNKINFMVKIHHLGRNTTGNVEIKAVLKDSAKLNFEGLLSVEKTASGTKTYLSQKSLLIGNGVKVNSAPSLEIKNNNVKCSHGVTIGRVGEEEIYYMMSRGLKCIQAEELVVEGFLN